MAGRVEGKVAIVTGATKGLGRADAEALAREGATVVMTDVDDSGKAVAAEIATATGATVVFKHQDVSSEERWAEIVAEVEDEFGGIDVLVNNAGIVIVATPEQCTLEQFRLHNAIMNEGVFLGCKAVIPAMRKRGGGSIINMSSIASHLGYPVFFAYTAAKGAVRAMTKSLAVTCQMNGDQIRVNSVHPGAIATPMVQAVNKELGMPEPNPDSTEDPIGVGRPEDVANMIVYLASDESRFVNGAELVIDNALSVQ
ncbi:MAG: SDR family oxidoreductase [Woeseiaceae bacterium]|nr:SDR family oxidoreductase [Woeseiaceae bacterium]